MVMSPQRPGDDTVCAGRVAGGCLDGSCAACDTPVRCQVGQEDVLLER